MPPKTATNSKRGSANRKSASEPRVTSKMTVDANGTTGLSPEMEDQFELELCWCIQELEVSVASGRLQKKQAQDLDKYIRSLKSNTAPLIKKRHIMKNILGDYREKMIEDERKLSKTVLTVKFSNPPSTNKKSLFIKKATRHSAQEFPERTDDCKIQDALVNTKRTIININRSQTPFQFNFQTSE